MAFCPNSLLVLSTQFKSWSSLVAWANVIHFGVPIAFGVMEDQATCWAGKTQVRAFQILPLE